MRELDRIEVKCRRRNSLEVLDTSTIEKICTNISNSQVDFARARYEHLQGLQLADAWCKDDTQYDLEIYLSIGLDQHWSVAVMKSIEERKGHSRSSKFGYTSG